jgi:hypothetical protein
VLRAVHRVPLLPYQASDRMGGRRGIFTSAGTIIRLLPTSIRSVALQPDSASAVAQTPLSESEARIMAAEDAAPRQITAAEFASRRRRGVSENDVFETAQKNL